MSPNEPNTLSALFDHLDEESARVELADEASRSKTLKDSVSVVEWSALVPTVLELLDIRVSHLLVTYWQKGDAVARALRESAESPDRTVDVSLYDCSTEATLSPVIEVRLAKSTLKRLQFTVALPMTFKAVQLRLKGGAVIDAIGGECHIGGNLALEGLTLATLKEPVRITLVKGFLGSPS